MALLLQRYILFETLLVAVSHSCQLSTSWHLHFLMRCYDQAGRKTIASSVYLAGCFDLDYSQSLMP